MRLSEYLATHGLSQNEFARRHRISQSQICRMVSLGGEPSLQLALRLLQATGGEVGLLDMLQGPPPEGIAPLVEEASRAVLERETASHAAS